MGISFSYIGLSCHVAAACRASPKFHVFITKALNHSVIQTSHGRMWHNDKGVITVSFMCKFCIILAAIQLVDKQIIVFSSFFHVGIQTF